MRNSYIGKRNIMDALPKNKYFYSSVVDPYEEKLKSIVYDNVKTDSVKKIVLIIPPSPQVPTPGREFLVTGPFEGFTYIASLIKQMGHDLKVIDCRLKENPVEHALNNAGDPDVIGIATYCDSFVFLREVTKRFKQVSPDAIIFFGGPLVTSLPKVILENTSADVAVLGEAELTLIEYLEECIGDSQKNYDDVKGIAYKNGQDIIINARRPQIKNLDNLPLLDYSIWPNCEDIIKNGQILISSMRGCPQECSFCFKTIPALRFKSIERFEQEVAYLKKVTGFTYTWLNDLTFNVAKERAIEVCNILQKHDIKYHVFARVKNVSKELCKVLKATGCQGIWYGIESYDQNILNANRKNIKIEEIHEAVDIANAEGIKVRGLFIVGLFGETEESLKSMLEYIKEGDFLPLVKYLVPFPGTSIYEYAVSKGIIKDVISFLELLSTRKVRDYDDEFVNVTDLDDEVIRKYFHEIWKITKEREADIA